MTNLNEQDLHKLTKELEAIEIPKEALHQARMKAVQQHRLTKKRKRRLYSGASVAAIMLVLLVASIRVSPVFAQTMAKIPGFDSIVHMISFDKGIGDIVENNYYEELGIKVTEGDYTLTLQGVVADHSGMTIFYKLESPFDLSDLSITSIEVSQQGIPFGVINSYITSHSGERKVHEDKVEITSTNDLSYDNKKFEFNLSLSDVAETKFAVPFTLTKPIEQPKVYEVNQTVVVDGQTIDIKQLKISPLRAEIRLAADEQNTMQLLKFTSIRLIDENGEEWGQQRNDSGGVSNLEDGDVNLFLQSNYFRQPKKITLEIDRIQALPKGSDYIEVDFEQKKVLYMPSDLDITVQVPSDNTLEVTYPSGGWLLFSQMVDQEGKSLSNNLIETHMSREEPYVTEVSTFDFEKVVNPIRFHINSYPLYLDGKLEIDIPLYE
ncbi:DUF4179 domain-containing protein [Psychrobacillus lasiicapitis]|uniref:DUF4179 domain-containing protein n=1 Tax=Psychrobacillus lasiicapitis TaxID=1636719 RepID=A0A544TGW6_9BACI|nr:DUF4179 domain-containing protein [Psychrobacillus lasiicapitis]TQR16671.1 DUF4179 domain-containing protein [Psychrobacillus lasiicapitis]GGA28202.1 hypothetical protein GCM10011384_16970 [Psychrobacillus lasiicapitis]